MVSIDLLAESRDRDLQFFWEELILEEELIKVEEIRVDGRSVDIELDKVIFQLEQSSQSLLQYFVELFPFLGMDDLVIRVLQLLVAVNVVDVELSVELEPLLGGSSFAHTSHLVLLEGDELHQVVILEFVECLFGLKFKMSRR